MPRPNKARAAPAKGLYERERRSLHTTSTLGISAFAAMITWRGWTDASYVAQVHSPWLFWTVVLFFWVLACSGWLRLFNRLRRSGKTDWT